MRALALAALVVACGGRTEPPRPVAAATPSRIAIVVSVDGLMPGAYAEPGLAVPTMRGMVAGGAWARSVRSVMPAVTYPAHTTIATGVSPAAHGIVSNRAFDPLEKNQKGWRWYAEDIRARTLWDAAAEAGKRAALLQWPVTVGARVHLLVPEYWRAGTAEDLKLLRAVSTPGLLAAAEKRFPDLWKHPALADGVVDQAVVDVAVHILESDPPDLLMVHLPVVDSMEHDHGPGSAEANAAIEAVDAQIARLVETCKARGLWERTAIFVVSDHGFAPVTTELRPMVKLREAGLVDVDASGAPTAWRAAIQANGGTAYVYLADPADRATADRVRALLPAGGPIRRVLEAGEIARLGGDPGAFLALEGADGVVFQEGVAGTWEKPSGSRGHHGWLPDDAAMNASFLALGPGIRPVALGDISLTDVAPTVAAWVGVTMPDTFGSALDIFHSIETHRGSP
ncbi:MAG TPA: alkaline phosphatase family protein [Kofleriaceae bacterium]|nr:alkaline phosphatase family protein [Kofleriaceae bacterium]